MKLVMVGLGKMGAQLANRLIEKGHSVVAFDPNEAAVQTAVGFGAEAANGRADAIHKFVNEPVVVWLMIPAQFIASEVTAWLEELPEGSILIDGGNTDFRITKQNALLASAKRVTFVDVGVSGGVLGTENGFSMMVGGSSESYQQLVPILDALSSPRGGHAFFGEPGSGHYVKMVHNAIEYGMMESLAEGYRMLKEGPFEHLDLAEAGAVWQKASVIESTLNSLASEILHEDKELNDADGYVAASGEAEWTLQVAKERSIDLPAIQAAVDVRRNSQDGETSYTTKLLAELRNKFGGHKINK